MIDRSVQEASSLQIDSVPLAAALVARGRLKSSLGDLPGALIDQESGAEILLRLQGPRPPYARALGNLGLTRVLLGLLAAVPQLVGEGMSNLRSSRDILASFLPDGHYSLLVADQMIEQVEELVWPREGR